MICDMQYCGCGWLFSRIYLYLNQKSCQLYRIFKLQLTVKQRLIFFLQISNQRMSFWNELMPHNTQCVAQRFDIQIEWNQHTNLHISQTNCTNDWQIENDEIGGNFRYSWTIYLSTRTEIPVVIFYSNDVCHKCH